jgi:heat shock protein HslJ
VTVLRAVCLAVLLVVALGACAAGAPASRSGDSHPATLEGTTWRLIAIQGRPVPVGVTVTLDFGPGQIAGDSGCNTFGGVLSYEPSTGALEVSDLISTKRACVEPIRNDVEATYLRALRAATSAEIDADGQLVITGAGAEVRLEVGPPPAAPPIKEPSSAH